MVAKSCYFANVVGHEEQRLNENISSWYFFGKLNSNSSLKSSKTLLVRQLINLVSKKMIDSVLIVSLSMS